MGALYVFLRKSLAVLCILFFVVAVSSVGSVFVVAEEPPSSGDWIVNGTESYSDQTIVLDGSLIIEGSGNLTFRGVTLKLNCAYDGQYNITVYGGEFCVLERSIITSVDSAKRYSFIVCNGSTFRMSDSELHQCGERLDIASDDVVIENSLISRNFNGIGVFGSGVVVRNNNITANERSGVVVVGKDRSPAIYNNYISLNNDSGINVLFGASPTIYDNMITSNLGDGIGMGMGNGTPIIRNNFITKNRAGIVFDNSSPTILNNTITSNLGQGIRCTHHSDPFITNNTIMSNGGDAIFLGDEANPVIDNNIIASNNGTGVSSHNGCKPTIVDNTIKSNLGAGVRCIGSSNATIQGNTIMSNTEPGIHCIDNSSPNVTNNTIILNDDVGISGSLNCSPIIQGNNITSNNGPGILLRPQCNGTIQGNIIANNHEGIQLSDHCNPLIQGNIIKSNSFHGIRCENNSLPEVHWNDIYGNKVFGVVNDDSSITVNATHNYWGSSSGPVQDGIPDAIDPEEVSENVLYTPWLTQSIFSAEITSPLAGEMASSTVRISTEVHAQHGVQKVEFYIDDKLKYTDYDASYEWNWDTTQYIETEHKITAKAHDNFGLKISTSITVSVDNTPPTVSIEEPLSGNTYYGTVTISVNATDNREVKDVRVKVDNSAWLGMTYNSTDSLWEYALNTTTLSDGQHTIMSLALDKAGNPTTTSMTIITDNNPPTLTIQSPTSGTTVGLTLVVSVQAIDVSNISKVEFYLLNVLVNTAYTAPYQWAWDTTEYPNGEYTITIKAYDSLGHIRSQDIPVRVYNVEVPWWQANFWTIVQVFIALGGLMFAIVTYWSRTRQKRKKKKRKKKEAGEVADTPSL